MEGLLSGDVVCDEMYTKTRAIIGAKQKGTRNIALRVIGRPAVNRGEAVDFLIDFVLANSNLFTDGGAIYRGIDKWHRVKHKFEIHKKFEFTLTAEIEGLWGCFRTFVRRMYHHVTAEKLPELVSEFCLRFRQDKIFENPISYWQECLMPCPLA